MELKDEQIEDGNVPEPMRAAQRLLDRFAEVSSDAAYTAMGHSYRSGGEAYDQGATYLKRQVLELLTANPPLATVPGYFNDGRENYLWYSDFFDDAGKDCFKRYNLFVYPADKITSANYVTELAKIDLPYFRELVRLVSLLKQIGYIEKFFTRKTSVAAPAKIAKDVQDGEAIDHGTGVNGEAVIAPERPEEGKAVAAEYEAAMDTHEDLPADPQPARELPKPDQPIAKRSYNPRLTDNQYDLLARCVEKLNLFRRPVSVGQLKKLLKGKLTEPLQVSNQKSLTCLFDELSKKQYIKSTWITIADHNKDFISFRRGRNLERYGSDPFPIPFQQFVNSRTRNKNEYVDGELEIEDLIKAMGKCPDK